MKPAGSAKGDMQELQTYKNDRKNLADTSLMRYEEEKQNWIESNPNASPALYERAMQEIAKRCGV